MTSHIHSTPRHLLARSTWIAAATGLAIALAWTLVPAARVVILVGAIAAVALGARRLSGPSKGRPPAALPRAADPVELLAAHGISKLEAYLAHHAAFAEYLQRRDGGGPQLDASTPR